MPSQYPATTTSSQTSFLIPKETPDPLVITLDSPSPSPWRPLIFLCLWICLFWPFHINGIAHCGALCFWLLSRSIMFPGFVAVCVSELRSLSRPSHLQCLYRQPVGPSAVVDVALHV